VLLLGLSTQRGLTAQRPVHCAAPGPVSTHWGLSCTTIEDFDRFRVDIVAITRACGIAVGHFITDRTVTGRFEPWDFM
jgi:hypothetical protein